eukprot:Amastigsp_a177017_13.p4 type:complete len:183 gc:universal Amastigsp_a177017_13:959-411(-)
MMMAITANDISARSLAVSRVPERKMPRMRPHGVIGSVRPAANFLAALSANLATTTWSASQNPAEMQNTRISARVAVLLCQSPCVKAWNVGCSRSAWPTHSLTMMATGRNSDRIHSGWSTNMAISDPIQSTVEKRTSRIHVHEHVRTWRHWHSHRERRNMCWRAPTAMSSRSTGSRWSSSSSS